MNKKYILVAVFTVIFSIMQTSAFPHMRILGNTPYFALVFLCIMAYFRGSSAGMYLGLIGGLTIDVMVGRSIGFYGLVFMTVCFIVGFFPRQNIKDNLFITLGITVAAVFPARLVVYWIEKISVYFAMNMDTFTAETGVGLTKNILPGLLYDCIVFIPLYFIGRRFDRFLDKDKKIIDAKSWLS